MLEENEARGFAATMMRVCQDCVGDKALGEVVLDIAEQEPCDYCGAAESAELDLVLEHMLEAIRFEYLPASEESPPWESAEGGYQAPHVWFPELLWEEMDADFGDPRVQVDLERALSGYLDAWFERDVYSLRPHEQLRLSWERFVKAVRRHGEVLLEPTAHLYEDPDAIIEPERMLGAIGDMIAEVPGSFRPIPAGTALFRGRGGRQVHDAASIGPRAAGTPVSGGRMNQPGQIFFYGALDLATAVREVTFRTHAPIVTVGPFRASNDLTLLDLTAARLQVPSIYDLDAQHRRPTIRFLRQFATLISDGRAHQRKRGYFPTQAVTEYVRTKLAATVGHPVDGILYPSARSATGTNAVLFFGAEACVNEGDAVGPKTRLVLDGGAVIEVVP